MNKPAPKEPSMDEILSSIRQIIADDDAASVPRRPAALKSAPPMEAAPARLVTDDETSDLSDMLDDIEPLALTPAQIVADDDDSVAGFSFDSILADTAAEAAPVEDEPAPLVEAEDITFEPEEELPAFDPAMLSEFDAELEPEPESPMAFAAETAFEPEPAPVIAPEPSPARVADVAPLPDPTLTSDIANELLEPATKAAVRNSIGKLNALGIGNPSLTIEAMMREMLRPMLKEWLDEHLPAVVERMVEREITRISRGE